ncbi:MAG: hypothetical protein Q7T01_02490 [bacterium]|nr:hypothetical protein [bacterium]
MTRKMTDRERSEQLMRAMRRSVAGLFRRNNLALGTAPWVRVPGGPKPRGWALPPDPDEGA